MSTNQVPMKSPEFLSEFPEKILLEIAAYVPDRFNLSQVSTQFYKIVCEVEENKKVLFIKRNDAGFLNIMDDQLFKSMMTTKRSVEMVKIKGPIQTSLEYDRLKELLLVKFGSFVKKLYWLPIEISLRDVIKILSLMPQLEDLEIPFIHIYGNSIFEEGKFPVHSIRLKTLKVIYGHDLKKLFRSPSDPASGKYFSDFIHPNLLETLEISRCDGIAAAVAMFLQSQPNLKSFIFDPSTDALSSYMGTNWPRRLTCLKLSDKYLPENDFNFICSNLGDLKELRFTCGFAPESLERIRELRHLQKLVVKNASDGWPHIRSESIIELKISGTNLDVVQVAENLPNLRQLELEGDRDTSLDVSLFLQSFKHLEELRFESFGSLQSAHTNNDGKSYPKMKKFIVRYCGKNRDDPEAVLNLLDLMPNMEDLDLGLSFDIGLEKPDEAEKEMLRIVEIFTQVKSKVKSFRFYLTTCVRDGKPLTKGLRRVFKGLKAKNMVNGGLSYKI